MRTQNNLGILFLMVLVAIACNRGGSSAGGGQPPGDPTLAGETSALCVPAAAKTNFEVKDGDQAPQGLWQIDNGSASSKDPSSNLWILAINGNGELSIFSDSFYPGKSRNKLECVAHFELGTLETPQAAASRIIIGDKALAQARANGVSEAEIQASKGSSLGTITVLSNDSLSWKKNGQSGLSLKRITASDAASMIVQRADRFAKSLEGRRAFAAKWVGKNLNLVQKTYAALDKNGKALFTNVTKNADLAETTKTTFEGQEIVLQNPKRIRFLNGKDALVNDKVTLPYSAQMSADGKLTIQIEQARNETIKFMIVKGVVSECEGGGLVFSSDFTLDAPLDGVKSSREVFEFSL